MITSWKHFLQGMYIHTVKSLFLFQKSTRSLKEATPDSESSVSNDKSEDEIDTSEDERTTDAEGSQLIVLAFILKVKYI